MNELCPMPGCRVEAITPDGPTLLHIAAHGTRPGGRCPVRAREPCRAQPLPPASG